MTTLPPLPAPDKFRNPWRTFIENCMDGSNYFRSSEYLRLLDDLDAGYAAIDTLAAQAVPAPIVVQPGQRDLLTALTKVMSWIDNWSPSFTEDAEWAEDEKAAREAIAFLDAHLLHGISAPVVPTLSPGDEK